MDHVRISCTEPPSVIISQKGSFKSWKVMTQSAKQEAQRATYRAPEYNVPPF